MHHLKTPSEKKVLHAMGSDISETFLVKSTQFTAESSFF